MPWRNPFKRKPKDAAPELPRAPLVPAEQTRVGPPVVGMPLSADDPAALERRRKRLERRLNDLRYDLRLAESATQEPNRWTERAAELDAAIAQARLDAEAAMAPPPDRSGFPLPSVPVTVERIVKSEPAEIVFRIGELRFRYSEELDWAERGAQKAEPVLQRVEGEIDPLLPDAIPAERRDDLREHLAHGLGTLAALLREGELDAYAASRMTLADLAEPCPVCGGWRDVRNRCPACQQRQWAAAALRADADRLLKERNDQLNEAHRWRERLGVLRRQLAETEAELDRLAG